MSKPKFIVGDKAKYVLLGNTPDLFGKVIGIKKVTTYLYNINDGLGHVIKDCEEGFLQTEEECLAAWMNLIDHNSPEYQKLMTQYAKLINEKKKGRGRKPRIKNGS